MYILQYANQTLGDISIKLNIIDYAKNRLKLLDILISSIWLIESKSRMDPFGLHARNVLTSYFFLRENINDLR